jgi:hypothetical protein
MPIGVIKLYVSKSSETLSIAETASTSLLDDHARFPIESLYDRMQRLLLGLLTEKRSEESKQTRYKIDTDQVDLEGLIVHNDLKSNFFSLLQ